MVRSLRSIIAWVTSAVLAVVLVAWSAAASLAEPTSDEIAAAHPSSDRSDVTMPFAEGESDSESDDSESDDSQADDRECDDDDVSLAHGRALRSCSLSRRDSPSPTFASHLRGRERGAPPTPPPER